MLTNYVADADLRKYYPKISNYLWTGSSDYSNQITEAFEIVLDDLRQKDIDPRKLHIPIDTNRDFDSSVKQDRLTRLTKTETGNNDKYAIGMTGFRRFTSEVVSPIGGTATPQLVITLQGSNDILSGSDSPANWEDIVSLTFTTAILQSIVFKKEYKYYRSKWVISGTNPSFVFTAGIVETYVDRWIIWKTFQLIFEDFSKDPEDVWAERALNASKRYGQAIEGSKFNMDKDDDNLPETGEEESAETTLWR